MAYQALYRKFRPNKFEDVKGQNFIIETLKNQIEANRIGHAYLFCGTRGTGKTTVAKIFARAVNCENLHEGSPCGECPSCKSILSGASMNVQEIDAASNNGVDNIRDIIDDTTFSPAQGRYKVYIIDEVHMLSTGAFNALLKTLEEPPAYVIFILATTEVHKIPLTILSRCQRYDFKRISVDVITERLQELMLTEEINAEDKALRYIAKSADGAMRDALSLLDQCIAFHYGKQLTYELVLDVLGAVDTEIFSKLLRDILQQNTLSCISLLEEMIMQGRELVQFMTDFTWYLRNLLLMKVSDHAEEIIDLSAENLNHLKEEAEMADENVIMRYIRVLSELSSRLRQTSQKRVMIELTLIKMCHPEMETEQDAVLDRIRVLEEKIEKGNFSHTTQNRAVEHAATDSKKTISKAPLPTAIPEDVKQVVAKWSSIVNNIGQPLKTYLKEVRLSVDQENNLLMIVQDINQYDWLNDSEHQEELRSSISGLIQKEIQIRIKLVKDRYEAEATYPDLSTIINMNIEEEQ